MWKWEWFGWFAPIEFWSICICVIWCIASNLLYVRILLRMALTLNMSSGLLQDVFRAFKTHKGSSFDYHPFATYWTWNTPFPAKRAWTYQFACWPQTTGVIYNLPEFLHHSPKDADSIHGVTTASRPIHLVTTGETALVRERWSFSCTIRHFLRIFIKFKCHNVWGWAVYMSSFDMRQQHVARRCFTT